MPVDYKKLPFAEGINYFRQKINLPTRTWTDIYEGMHSRAFVVAGAMKQELLTDLRSIVDTAIAEGAGIEAFRKGFDQVVAKHGWSYNGGRGWRTRVIYETNMRQAYNAGREKQMLDPDLRAARPYGLYKHGDPITPRPDHEANDDLVLPLDDPWWDVWTPMNGWGCTCKKYTLSASDVKARGLTISTQAPAIEYVEKTIGARGPNPRTVKVPKGIDPGFAYNPGTAAWGRPLSEETMSAWQAQGPKAWTPLTSGGPETFNRPDKVPTVTTKIKPVERAATRDQVTDRLKQQLSGDEQIFNAAGLPVLVNAVTLSEHIDLKQSEYLPLLNDTLSDPYEVWYRFEQHNGTGMVELRSRIIKAYNLDGKQVLVSAAAVRGMLESVSIITTNRIKYADKFRLGRLLYGKKT